MERMIISLNVAQGPFPGWQRLNLTVVEGPDVATTLKLTEEFIQTYAEIAGDSAEVVNTGEDAEFSVWALAGGSQLVAQPVPSPEEVLADLRKEKMRA